MATRSLGLRTANRAAGSGPRWTLCGRSAKQVLGRLFGMGASLWGHREAQQNVAPRCGPKATAAKSRFPPRPGPKGKFVLDSILSSVIIQLSNNRFDAIKIYWENDGQES